MPQWNHFQYSRGLNNSILPIAGLIGWRSDSLASYLVHALVWGVLPQCRYHHHVVPPARISLTLSRHFSLSFIASGRSSGLHPVSSHSCYMYVRAGRPAFTRAYVGVQRSTSLLSSSLHLQQCLACLVRLTWIVFVMGGRWPYSWCFVGRCLQDYFNITRSILSRKLFKLDEPDMQDTAGEAGTNS